MALLANVGDRLSRFLHHAIYSFPSAQNSSGARNATGPESTIAEMLSEPGEPRAWAGGIGPLSFAGSGYGIMLVLMGILLNRIHHIVRRPRVPAPPLPHPQYGYFSRARATLRELLTSPEMPRYIRLPGLFSLIRAWVLFTILTLQVANLWPVDSTWLHDKSYGRVINRVGHWAGEMQMEKVCWQVFLSVCTGLICSGLANGLDRGRRRDIGAGFNLFGYSFLLHLYSSPLTHHRPPPAANHGRPDLNALFQLWLSLTELTWLQAIELSVDLRRNQLLPTGVCGMLGLTHFVYALSTSPLKFPSFTFMTHLLALFLLIIILLSLLLRGFTYIFTIGYIPSPIFRNLLPHEGVYPSAEDDFGVALLKLGTACIEATQYSGLRNELVSVEERNGPWLELTHGSSEVFKGHSALGGFNSEITQIEVAKLQDPHSKRPYPTALMTFLKACGRTAIVLAWSTINATPLGRKVVDYSIRLWRSRWWYGPRSWRVWQRQAWAEPPALEAARVERVLRARLERITRNVVSVNTANDRSSSGQSSSFQLRHREETPMAGPSVYDDFLRGEIMSDDEDAERDWEEIDDSSSEASDIGLEVEDVDEVDPALYRDLLNESSESSGDIQPVLLAHMTTSSSTPLTRRRYAAILNSGSSPSRAVTPVANDIQDIMRDRRMEMAGRNHEPWDEDRRACVVCTIEPRDTILWPCRCLALCNECRESLAARLSAPDHMCPCCRRKVDGYSRIYVP